MSLNDTNSSSSDTLTAEFRDGRLQIVEYSPADDEGGEDDQNGLEVVDTDYIHIVNQNDNQAWQLGNLNFTIARCDQETQDNYAILPEVSEQIPQEYVLNGEQQEIRAEMGEDDSSYVIMFNPDDEDEGEYAVLENAETSGNDSYVVVHGKEGPMVFLQSQLQITQQPPEPTSTIPKKGIPTALDLLKKAKAVKKAKAILHNSLCSSGRRRNTPIPSAEQLLHSPDFKIYLYSCKQCDFQCNMIKEMTEHKAKEHLKKRCNVKARYPYKNSLGGGRSMQCARCPYRATIISDLLNHVKQSHPEAKEDQLKGGSIGPAQNSSEDCLGKHTCTQARANVGAQHELTLLAACPPEASERTERCQDA